jgi:catechol-2,3-dioxygenase
MHLHVSVDDLNKSIGFYNSLFGSEPTVSKPDYAKWMLEDPLVNFAISKRGATPGLDHIGIQVETDTELTEIKDRLDKAEMSLLTEEGTTCCYSRSDKHWVQDPSGIAWETYRTLDTSPTFSNHQSEADTTNGACCAPASQKVQFISRKQK